MEKFLCACSFRSFFSFRLICTSCQGNVPLEHNQVYNVHHYREYVIGGRDIREDSDIEMQEKMRIVIKVFTFYISKTQ